MAGFADCFSAIDFARQRTIVAAVSGGSDSTALLVLALDHLKQVAPAAELVAVTVDHGLRPESASEAGHVAALCGRLGVRHVTKRWSGFKPENGIQAAAREARYDLIGASAAELGAGLVLTGHTIDDQLETVLMRRERGEGPGLAGIAPATLAFRDDGAAPVWFARPLLGLGRTELRNELLRRGIGWIDDPSNANTEYERVRARLEAAALDLHKIAFLHDLQARWAHRRQVLSQRIGNVIRAHVRPAAPGLRLVAPGLWHEDDTEAATEALRIVMAFAGGCAHMIEHEAALAFLDRLRAGESVRATGSRALLDSRKQGLFVLREDRDVRASFPDFDGRYVLGPHVADIPAAAAGSDAPQGLIGHARRLEPPHDRVIVRRKLNPWAKRVPLFDLASACALARLAGEPDFSPPPCSL
jgi:tRNA(Ile)-lysidine synthase